MITFLFYWSVLGLIWLVIAVVFFDHLADKLSGIYFELFALTFGPVVFSIRIIGTVAGRIPFLGH